MKRRTISIKNVFYIAFAIMEANILFSATGFPPSVSGSFSKIVSVAFFIICIVKILSSRYTLHEALFYAVLLALLVTSSIVSGDNRALWLGLSIVCVKDLDKRRIIKNSLYIVASVLFIAVFCSIIGVVEITKTDYLGNIRIVLGMGHPNVLSLFFNLVILHLAFLYYDKIGIKHVVICTLVTIILFAMCQSRTGLIAYIVSLAFFVLFKRTKSRKIIAGSCVIVAMLAIAFSVLPILYNPNITALAEMNSFFTGRLAQAHYYYDQYGIKMFGQKLFEELNMVGTQNILDIGYSRMYLYNGLVYYFVVIFGYILLMRKAIMTNNRKLMLLVCFFLVYMCSENPGTYIFFNISMLYFFGGISRKVLGDGKDS